MNASIAGSIVVVGMLTVRLIAAGSLAFALQALTKAPNISTSTLIGAGSVLLAEALMVAALWLGVRSSRSRWSYRVGAVAGTVLFWGSVSIRADSDEIGAFWALIQGAAIGALIASLGVGATLLGQLIISAAVRTRACLWRP